MELMAVGQGVNAASSLFQGSAENAMAKANAAGERAAATQQVGNILKATEQRRGAARAATAASGTVVDEFSLGNEQEIVQAGETDAAMTLLTGERNARSYEMQGKLAKANAGMSAASSLFKASSSLGKGWTGAKGDSYSYNDDASGTKYSATGADIRARR
jgi:hypothetical protein